MQLLKNILLVTLLFCLTMLIVANEMEDQIIGEIQIGHNVFSYELKGKAEFCHYMHKVLNSNENNQIFSIPSIETESPVMQIDSEGKLSINKNGIDKDKKEHIVIKDYRSQILFDSNAMDETSDEDNSQKKDLKNGENVAAIFNNNDLIINITFKKNLKRVRLQTDEDDPSPKRKKNTKISESSLKELSEEKEQQQKLQEELLTILDINQKNKKGQTPLIEALCDSQYPIMPSTLPYDEAQSKKNNANNANDYFLKKAKLLIERGADVTIVDSNRWTPLMYAAFYGYLEMTQLLIEKNIAIVDQQNEDEMTALMYALFNGHVEVAELLFQNSENTQEALDKKDINGRTALMYAAMDDNVEMIQFLITKGVNVNDIDKTEQTALMLALFNGHTKIAKLLFPITLNTQEALNKKDINGQTPLICAAAIGNFEMVQFMLDKGVDVNIANNSDVKALTYAASNNQVKITELLFPITLNGQDALDKKDINGKTALMRAAKNDNFEMAQLLIDKGADVNIADENGWTALMYALFNGHVKVAELLFPITLNAQNALDKKDVNEQTPLIWAASSNNAKMAQFLIDKGADVNIAGKNGITALMHAANIGAIDTINLLLNSNAHVNATNKLEQTALMFASMYGHEIIVDLLLQRGANANFAANEKTALVCALFHGQVRSAELLLPKTLNPKDVFDKQYAHGWSLLMHAAMYNDFETVTFLITRGADADIQDDNKWTALIHAIYANNKKIAKLLMKRMTDINVGDKNGQTALIHAAKNGNYKIVKSFLHPEIYKKVDVNIADNNGCTALMYALLKGHLKIAELLFPITLNVHNVLNTKNCMGQTFLMRAAINSDYNMAQFLLDKGADVNIEGDDKWTALMWAIWRGNNRITTLFINKKSVDVNHADANGNTPLLLAARKGSSEIVRLLIAKDADVNKATNDGVTALQLATHKKNKKIIKLIEKRNKETHANYDS